MNHVLGEVAFVARLTLKHFETVTKLRSPSLRFISQLQSANLLLRLLRVQSACIQIFAPKQCSPWQWQSTKQNIRFVPKHCERKFEKAESSHSTLWSCGSILMRWKESLTWFNILRGVQNVAVPAKHHHQSAIIASFANCPEQLVFRASTPFNLLALISHNWLVIDLQYRQD